MVRQLNLYKLHLIYLFLLIQLYYISSPFQKQHLFNLDTAKSLDNGLLILTTTSFSKQTNAQQSTHIKHQHHIEAKTGNLPHF